MPLSTDDTHACMKETAKAQQTYVYILYMVCSKAGIQNSHISFEKNE